MVAKWLLGIATLAFASAACEWDPARPLEHYAPDVDRALAVLDAGDASAAAHVLAEYLETNECTKGQIAISKALREKERAGLDLGLVLFHVAESYGKRFTEDDRAQAAAASGERGDHVTCALAVVRELGESGTAADRARAAFVEGNLLFFNGAYKDALEAYDRALAFAPPAEGDDTSLGADVAFNRAIALARSKEDPPDAGDGGDPDGSSNDAASPDASGNDAGPESDGSTGDSPDAAPESQPDAGESPPDAGTPPPEARDGGDGQDSGAPPPPPEELADGGPSQPPPEALERLLDDLERAPTVQEESLRRTRHKRIRPEEDK